MYSDVNVLENVFPQNSNLWNICVWRLHYKFNKHIVYVSLQYAEIKLFTGKTVALQVSELKGTV